VLLTTPNGLRGLPREVREVLKSSGKVIGGKLRGCEGIADIAFLEWLVPKGSMGEATLWARYLEDYNVEVPYEMVPRSCVRPPNLKTQLNEVMKRRAQYKGEVKKGREKIEDLRSTVRSLLHQANREIQVWQAERGSYKDGADEGCLLRRGGNGTAGQCQR